ncbi:hypothetical protein [Maridesulfovibrio zosterae]|uniref:hypothetical protein n=1 Tax=Maridesulfovibrio zosterae TaxID=82171 RepID=UPI00146DA02F|nr:hypothetical protein [Maridesulfovibrio zosterae]
MDKFNNEERDYLTSIDDCSTATLGFIFDKIRSVIKEKALAPKVRENCPRKFIDYFAEDTNRDIFINTTSQHTSSSNTITIRDYYLYLLHVAGSPGLRKEAMLISTFHNRGKEARHQRFHN